VNFTREPIIETILSPKDGYKLCIKNSKIADSEELFVDAIEVVSFGNAFFFRGQERPKPFFVPVSDYQVFEVKETRVVLKNATHERNIKIGGGRETPKPSKEASVEKPEEEAKDPVTADGKPEKKRERRRNRRRKVSDDKKDSSDSEKTEEVSPAALEEGVESSKSKPPEEIITSAMFTSLLPPPPKLISEQLEHIREQAAAAEAKKLRADMEVDTLNTEEAKEPPIITDPQEEKPEEQKQKEEKSEEVPSLVPEETGKDDSFFS
jgi:hypothetical protein